MVNKKKLFYIIPPGNKLKIFLLFIFSLIGVFLEVVGIGAVLPAVSLITDTDRSFFGFDFYDLYKNSFFFGYLDFDATVLFVLFLIFFIKFIFFLFLTWFQLSFVTDLSVQMSRTLFQKYLFSNYSLFFTKNSSEFMRNVINEGNGFIKKVFIPIIQTFMDFLILLGIVLLIFSVDVKSSIILLVIYGTFVILYISTIKKKLFKIGQEQLIHSRLKMKSSQEAFQGIKTLKIFLKEKKFIDRYVYHFWRDANFSRIIGFIQVVPKYSIEIITVSSFIFISLFMLKGNIKFIDIVPTLALYITAAIRIIPSISRLTNNNQMIKTGTAGLNNLYNEFKNLEKVQTDNLKIKNLDFEKNISLNNISFSYSEKSSKILNDINLIIKKGEAIGIVGKTGSGKTTFVDLILGLIDPSKGEVLVDNININQNKRGWINIIGYVPQEIFIFDDTVKNNIIFDFSKEIDINRLNIAINKSALNSFMDTEGLETNTGDRGSRLSGGQKQRIGIARAIYKKSKLIIFDEPTSSLDTNTEKDIMNNIYKLKSENTLIIISHKSSSLEECDRIFEIKNGKLLQLK